MKEGPKAQIPLRQSVSGWVVPTFLILCLFLTETLSHYLFLSLNIWVLLLYVVVALFLIKIKFLVQKSSMASIVESGWQVLPFIYPFLLTTFTHCFFTSSWVWCLIIVSSCPRFSFFVDHCWFWTLYVHVPMYVCE